MRERILAAALRQLNARGIKFTTAELARELGVSKRAIYGHYSAKEALVDAVLDSILADLRQQIADIVQDENLALPDKVKALMVFHPKAFGPVNTQVIEDIKRFFPQGWRKFEEFFDERWRMLEEAIEDGVNRGYLAKVDLIILKKIYMGAIDQLLDFQFLVHNNITFSDAMTKAAEILVEGLTVPSDKQ